MSKGEWVIQLTKIVLGLALIYYAGIIHGDLLQIIKCIK
jgi:hypothetical protein